MSTQELPVATVISFQEKAEAKDQEWFDLLPIEKKLCGYTLGVGVALLAVFIFTFEVL